jgi:4-carboxymuconolactone decarboxylase
MGNNDRHERGLKKIKEIYGEKWDVKFLDDISPEFGRYTVDFLYGDVYDIKTLDARSREVAIIASLVTLGNATTPLKIHIHGALNVGCSRQEIIEVIIQTSVYAGFPAAVSALGVAREVFKEDGKPEDIPG